MVSRPAFPVHLVAVVVLGLAVAPSVRAADTAGGDTPTATTEQDRMQRLVDLGKLWCELRVFHPYPGYRDIDWDAAFVQAFAEMKAVNSTEEYSAVIDRMLGKLGDPVTRVLEKSDRALTPSPGAAPRTKPTSTLGSDGLLVVDMGVHTDLNDGADVVKTLQDAAAALPKARAVLIDLRSTAAVADESWAGLPILFQESDLARLVTTKPFKFPGDRVRQYDGLPGQAEPAERTGSSFHIEDGVGLQPLPGARDIPVVFLVNAYSEMPSVMSALQAAGTGFLVAEGDIDDRAVVQTQTRTLHGDVQVAFRVSEVVNPDGSGGINVDLAIPTPSGGATEDQALTSARSFALGPPVSTRHPTLLAPGVMRPDNQYAEMRFPAVEYRLLAVFKVWSAFHYFAPYLELAHEDWDAILREFITRMESVPGELEYHLAVAEMVAHIHDCHGFVNSPVLRESFGAIPPIRAMFIEGAVVITGFRDEKVARDAKIEIGDVVLSIDGEDALQRMQRLSKYIAASTPQALNRDLLNQRCQYNLGLGIFSGSDKSTMLLTLRGRNGKTKNARLPRSYDYRAGNGFERTGDVTRLLPGNLGYADLDRLKVPDVDKMFEAFKDTRGIIFDMRGYPNVTAWAIAPHLTDRNPVPAALFTSPIVTSTQGFLIDEKTTQSFLQPIPRPRKPLYTGKTVMLIDERTQSQAEHTGLFFEAANGTKFVGSPTAGANGGVTNFYLPGAILIFFTGIEVRHADGRQLQRIGLVPDVEVRPTVKGIQAGRDEVLDKAIEFLESELAPISN